MASLLWDYKYLSKTHLAGFDNYKYSCIDTSPLSKYVMHPFWNQLVKLCPLWFPANLLTLTGWMLSLFMFLLVSYYDPNFLSISAVGQTIPRWVWLAGAISIFCAHQLDGIDGKQARRTNSGSPLGELLDHGCDSLIVTFMVLGIMTCFGVSEKTALPLELFFIFVIVLYAFYFSHWEKYTTSIMYLPWAYDISQIFLTSAYLFTFVYGPEIWRTEIYEDLNVTQFLKMVLYVVAPGLCVPMCIYNQYVARRDRAHQCVGFFEGFIPMTGLTAVTILYFCFGYFSHADIIRNNLRWFCFAYGLIYGNLNCRLILAQMSATKCDRFNKLALPIFPMMVCGQLQLIREDTMLFAYIAFLSIAQLHYGVNVVRQLCNHLNIYAFKVGKPPVNKMNGHTSHSNGISNGSTPNGTKKD